MKTGHDGARPFTGALPLLTGMALLAVLATSPMRVLLEDHLVSHVLIQLPLLVLAGMSIGSVLRPAHAGALARWDHGGFSGLTLALVVVAFWMLPRNLDGALWWPGLELAKFISLPLGVGLPLALSWPRAHTLLRGFVKAHVVSMLAVLAWLYTVAPVRLCNAYLFDDQKSLGLAFALLGLVLALFWGGRLFVPPAGAPERPAPVPVGLGPRE
jgi:hypothetical protein